MNKITISIGCDHAGFSYKAAIIDHLKSQNFNIIDFGTFSTESVDYPDFVHPVAKSIELKESTYGILLCGSGQGVCITANKHTSIRAALVWIEEIALLSRQHNNANVICLPARFITQNQAIQFIDLFLATQFEGGRHAKRVDKITHF